MFHVSFLLRGGDLVTGSRCFRRFSVELLPPSISRTARLLEAMKAEGYDVGDLPEETGDGGFRFRLYVSGGKSFKSFTSK